MVARSRAVSLTHLLLHNHTEGSFQGFKMLGELTPESELPAWVCITITNLRLDEMVVWCQGLIDALVMHTEKATRLKAKACIENLMKACSPEYRYSNGFRFNLRDVP